MNLPPDQLKLRLDAARMTLERLLGASDLSHDTATAIASAHWWIERELRLFEQEPRR